MKNSMHNNKFSVRKAIILAGGFGTRMKEYTKDMPKPMLPLQGRPILEHNIELCKKYGITNIAISVHYHKEKIKEHFKDGKDFGVNIVYMEEDQPMGTAGAIRLYKEWFDQPFLMWNSDNIQNIDLLEMHDVHSTNNAWGTVALTQVNDPSSYGVVALNGSQITQFVEKPPKEQAPSNLINAGLYILNPEIVQLIPEGFSMVEKTVLPMLAMQGKLYGYNLTGQWFDVGTPEKYALAQKTWQGFGNNKALPLSAS